MSDYTTETTGGGTYFKPAQYADVKAVLIEPKMYLTGRPNGNFAGTRTELTADLTIFRNQESIDGNIEPEVLSNALLTNIGLTQDFDAPAARTKPAIFRLILKPPSKPGYKPFFCWTTVSDDVAHGVIEYAERREAEIKAALDDLPDFLKN